MDCSMNLPAQPTTASRRIPGTVPTSFFAMLSCVSGDVCVTTAFVAMVCLLECLGVWVVVFASANVRVLPGHFADDAEAHQQGQQKRKRDRPRIQRDAVQPIFL